MTEKEQLEYAAKALGLDYKVAPDGTSVVLFEDDYAEWNPLHDQADSDSMACDLELDIEFEVGLVRTWKGAGKISEVAHDNTIEGRLAAVRQARLLVAVEIGRALP